MKCDILVIGSGYGGSVAAARLANFGKVVLLEQGREWREGEFPTCFFSQIPLFGKVPTPRKLFVLRIGKGVGVVFANALGGASVVNYGIALEAPSKVFKNWPISLEEMKKGYEKAKSVLRPSSHPCSGTFSEVRFFKQVGSSPLFLQNAIDWERCTDCGHCVPGCNFGAKRHLLFTYLALAKEKGVVILDCHKALEIHKTFGGYGIRAWDQKKRTCKTIQAKQVILAGGTFGSLEFLFQNRHFFSLPPLFGKNMSMNGDAMALLYNTPWKLSSHLGAPVTSCVQLFSEEGKLLTVMSGRFPYSILRLSAFLMATLGLWFGESKTKAKGFWKRWGMDLLGKPERGGLSHTFMYKLDGQDRALGAMRFDRWGRGYLDWPDYRQDPILLFADRKLKEWADNTKAFLIPNLGDLPLLVSFGVHPLGGCAMAESVTGGVVDPWGRVFRPDGSVHKGIHVLDASILPSSLGVPPSLTIAALVEVVVERMERDL